MIRDIAHYSFTKYHLIHTCKRESNKFRPTSNSKLEKDDKKRCHSPPHATPTHPTWHWTWNKQERAKIYYARSPFVLKGKVIVDAEGKITKEVDVMLFGVHFICNVALPYRILSPLETANQNCLNIQNNKYSMYI